MLYFPLSKFARSTEAVVAAGATIAAEGQALVRLAASQSAGVLPSAAAAATEVFCGFAIAGLSAAPIAAPYAGKVETFVVPAGGSVTLAFTPAAGQILVWDVTAGAAVVIAGGVTLTANVLAGLTAAHTVTVTYRYALSVLQSRAMQGDIQPGGYAGAYVGQIGVVQAGVVYTSEFDASKNWAAATSIKLAANGQLTDQTGAGNTITATIIATPTEDVPYLGLEFNAV